MATKEELKESIENLIGKIYEIIDECEDAEFALDDIYQQLESFEGYLDQV